MKKLYWFLFQAVLVFVFVGGIAMVHKKGRLVDYYIKRDLVASGEPGDQPVDSDRDTLFVIQKHGASHLHFDFRLEIDGVLVSWAIPKGPSINPAQKRLAVRTEDHPLSYAQFEGVIPEGNYGAGPVMIWDTGTFKNITYQDGLLVPLSECLKKGVIEFFLHGSLLKGRYVLVRFKNDKKSWLLIKIDDQYASLSEDLVKKHKKSIVSGRTMIEIAQQEGEL